MALNIIPAPIVITLIPQSQLASSPVADFQASLWAEFGRLDIADSTRQKYVKAIEYFCQFAYERAATPETIAQFLALDRFSALEKVLAFRRYSIDKGLSASTINVRLAAIKSLTNLARKLGKTTINLGDVEGLPTETYRDTRGIDVEQFKTMFDLVDISTPIGVRDKALLWIFWSNALRRGEIVKCNVEDFQPQERRLMVLRKGKRAKVAIDLTDGVVRAISQWLECHPHPQPDSPLFVGLSRHGYGGRINGDSIYRIVCERAKAAGIDKVVSPHRLRHSSITALLDANDGNIRDAQAHSGHRNVNTLTRYDDNLKQRQRQAATLLDDLLLGL